ncbi:MAG: hypothetical protein NTW59_02880 [Candidatus Diapherotrites archaeon]|nr:hypothetical protein [Candidatus Diapherotrites archaeon]
MDPFILKEIGFSENEIKVYMELQKSQMLGASELARRAAINRTLCYQILNKLISKGLVGYVIKNNVKFFMAAHPSKLIDYLKEKQQAVSQLIPLMLEMRPVAERDYSAELFEGKEGLKTIMNDIIRSKPKEWLDLTSGMTTILLPEYYMQQWEKKRAYAKIRARFLVNDTPEGRERGKSLVNLKLSQTRYLPKGLIAPCHIYVYGNKVGITLWSEDSPFGVLIKSREIAQRFSEFFNWLWKISK